MLRRLPVHDNQADCQSGIKFVHCSNCAGCDCFIVAQTLQGRTAYHVGLQGTAGYSSPLHTSTFGSYVVNTTYENGDPVHFETKLAPEQHSAL
jgi:pyruvate/2-oxoacid:ferredoxin oxidoreductase beta subunit